MKKKRRVHKGRILFFCIVFCTLITVIINFLLHPETRETGSYYDLSLFQNDVSGFKVYNDPDYESQIGIDVSEHNGVIDWNTVAGTGIDFAFIRVGYRGGIEGQLHEDAMYVTNIEQARQAGLQIGVYWYSSAINETELQEEVDFVLSCLQNQSLNLPIVFDMEFFDEEQGRINALSVQEKTDLVLRFCQSMEQQGYSSMIYGNLDWLYNQLDFEQIQDQNLWYAAYQDKPAMQDRFMIWQYSNTGTLPGISTHVDMNIMPVKK